MGRYHDGIDALIIILNFRCMYNFLYVRTYYCMCTVLCSYSQLSDSQFEQILSGEADLEEFVPTKKKEEKDKK